MSAAQSGPLDWVSQVLPEALRAAFEECSADREARVSLDKLQLPVGEHILREDVPSMVARAARREALTGPELAALLKCFLLDVSATMGWPEFQRSWEALRALASSGSSAPGAVGRGRGRAAAAAAVAVRQVAVPSCAPRTAQQEIGFWHGAAPSLPKQRCEEPGSTYRPLAGSDITRGGQGASAASYYGMYLS
ncbi:hypothetical protein ABPG75_003473 [Micractinium tetrahymenae]